MTKRICFEAKETPSEMYLSPNNRYVLVYCAAFIGDRIYAPLENIDVVYDLQELKEVFRCRERERKAIAVTDHGVIFVNTARRPVAIYSRFEEKNQKKWGQQEWRKEFERLARRTKGQRKEKWERDEERQQKKEKRIRRKAIRPHLTSVSPHGVYFALVGFECDRVFVYNSRTLREETRIDVPKELKRAIRGCAFTRPDELCVRFCTSAGSSLLITRNFPLGTTTKTIQWGYPVALMGDYILTALSGELSVWKQGDNSKQKKVYGRQFIHREVALSTPNGSYFSVRMGAVIIIVDTESLEEVCMYDFTLSRIFDGHRPSIAVLGDLSGAVVYEPEENQVVVYDFLPKQKIFDLCCGLFEYDLPPYVLLLIWDTWNWLDETSRMGTKSFKISERFLHYKKIKFIQSCLAILLKKRL